MTDKAELRRLAERLRAYDKRSFGACHEAAAALLSLLDEIEGLKLENFGLATRLEEITDAARRVLDWVEPITGDNCDKKAAKEERESVNALCAVLAKGEG